MNSHFAPTNLVQTCS